jgi:hypothetical protein
MAKIIITPELRNHVNTICAESKAWAEAAPEGEMRGYCSFDEADILHYCEHYTKGERCLTPAEWDQAKAWEEYYDAHKAAYGIRPRWTYWSDETTEAWEKMSSDCYAQANADYELEQIKKEAEESYKTHPFRYESPAELPNKIIF